MLRILLRILPRIPFMFQGFYLVLSIHSGRFHEATVDRVHNDDADNVNQILIAIGFLKLIKNFMNPKGSADVRKIFRTANKWGMCGSSDTLHC